MADGKKGPRAHVLITSQRGAKMVRKLSMTKSRKQVAGQTQIGQTPHYIVYSDGSSDGDTSAKNVLAVCEADYAAVQGWFGLDLPPGQEGDDQTNPRTALPLHVSMDSQAGGAYHYGCPATDIYIQPQPDSASGLVVAELVEIFEAAINNGWACGNTNGEGLSRVLAVERNNTLASILGTTANTWWNNGHKDYVNNNDANDQDEQSNGCGPLFLYYLHNQLNFSWEQITKAGGATLGACYQKLTGQDPNQGFQDFLGRLATIDTGSGLNLPTSGNPFPIGSTAAPRDTTPSFPNITGSGGTIAMVAVVALVVIGVIIFLVMRR
ncbi:MAG: hypothetical protein IVW57_03995 [Ktedonobacterales bacterium]|nr:hypothetical protein [Ktedonobacterales bacterium]